MTGQPLTLRKSKTISLNMPVILIIIMIHIIRIMEYYALHYLKCSHDTYDPERGVVQLPQTVKVLIEDSENTVILLTIERGWSH